LEGWAAVITPRLPDLSKAKESMWSEIWSDGPSAHSVAHGR